MEQVLNLTSVNRRVAVISGLRTPFAIPDSVYVNLDAYDLGKAVIHELLNRSEIDPSWIDRVYFGSAIPSSGTENLANEISGRSTIPSEVPALSLLGSSLSGVQAVTSAVDSISLGFADVVLAGGVESITHARLQSLLKNNPTTRRLKTSKSLFERIRSVKKQAEPGIVPEITLLDGGRSDCNGLVHADRLALDFQISRARQDDYALTSHSRATAAHETIIHNYIADLYVPPDYTHVNKTDSFLQKSLEIESLSAFEPLSPWDLGTVTEGNSAPLADGASALLLMAEDTARSLGYEPSLFIRGYAYASAHNEKDRFLTTYSSTVEALRRSSIAIGEIELIEMHELFAAEVIANCQLFGRNTEAGIKQNREQSSWMDRIRVNPLGGSIAVGHPPAATPGRLIINMLVQTTQREWSLGLCSVSTMEGQGCTMILERA